MNFWQGYGLFLLCIYAIAYAIACIADERKKRREKLRNIRAERIRDKRKKKFKDLQWAVMSHTARQNRKRGVTIWIKSA